MTHETKVFEKLVFSQIIKKFPAPYKTDYPYKAQSVLQLDPTWSQINPAIV